ncbi:MAG TPA: hypothetical protein VHB18_16715 [Mycobacteriales bacterium]|jgi:hypothetical protein|nr:hypothetical protein [Mycobacteriales bacterium]
MTYEDDQVVCDDSALTIKRYYFPFGSKRIPYDSIKGVQRLELTGVNAVRRGRIWGSGDLVHWWNLDTGRFRKGAALVIDIGKTVKPTITPKDPDTVERILTAAR